MTFTFDLHDEAYYVWRAAGVHDALLVHVDAHHDAAADPPWKTVDIGNYVRAAIRDGIVGEVRWAIPDPIWDDTRSRALVLSELDGIGDDGVVGDAASAASRIEGAPVSIGPWDAVAPRGAAVLLDVDVDYLLTAAYEERRSAPPLPFPWCWPRELVTRIARHDLQRIATTIASSTTGGFAPLEWAHLAREIALRLDGATALPSLACFDSLRTAALRRQAGDTEAACGDCRRAVDRCPSEPAGFVHLAECCAALGRMDEAREAFACACRLDPWYAHPFRTRGPSLLRRGRLEGAEAAFRGALDMAPDDAHAHAGLALIALTRGRLDESRALARRALELGPETIDAWRTLARAAAGLNDPRGAIQAYQHALQMALHGAAPIDGPWASNPERRLIDARHWDDHAALGELYGTIGDEQAAAAHRRMAAAGAPGPFGRPSGGVLPS